MLRELHIRNFALIDEVSIELGPGLNVFTGATGVGKSLVMGALGLLLGGRASSESVRRGADRAVVSGGFELSTPGVAELVADLIGAEPEDGVLAIAREVDASGRSRCRVNGVTVTVSMLKQMGSWLVDIHGQRDHESLRQPVHQTEMLDRFAGLTPDREAFAEARAQAMALRERRSHVRDHLDELRREADFLTFQLTEIDAGQLVPGEDDRLEEERKVLASAERLQETTRAAHAGLYESDESVCGRLQHLSRDLAEAAQIDSRLADVVAACEQAQVQLEDAAFMLQRYQEDFSYDPQRLAEVEERLDLIHSLQTKYGFTVADILAKREALGSRLEELTADSEGLDALEAELAERLGTLRTLAAALTAARKTAGAKLARAVERELKDLDMGAGRFRVDVQAPDLEGEDMLDASGPMGLDRVEFHISTNAGEEPLALRRIASGGEVSRTMLAIRKCLAEADRVSVFVFDEIDANIGGRLGSVVGQKLHEVSRSHQILCVTHLPQIACFADRQLKVHKHVQAGRTTTQVAALDDDARCDELAEMIRGDERTDLTRAQAQEMLRAADAHKASSAAKGPGRKRSRKRA